MAAHDLVIDAKGLTKVYGTGGSEVHALRGIDIEVRRGEMLAIMGTSGSGKSTLMNILGCLDQPTDGVYVLNDSVVNGLDRDQLADIRNREIGFVFQGFNLLARTTALDNVELPLLYDRSGRKLDTKGMARAALERVGLADRMDHQPSELSGGQQQRVAIARALVTNPTLILADEPTGNLDTHTSIEVLALFQELNDQGVTVLLVTHEPDIAAYAPRVIELRDGLVMHDRATGRREVAVRDLENLEPLEPDSGPAGAVLPGKAVEARS